MSAVTHEAEQGPLDLNNQDDASTEGASQDEETEPTQKGDLLTLKSSRPNRVEEEDDSLASYNHVESEEFGPLQTPIPVLERPSSADGSLSIPDDSPSLQVRPTHI